MNQELKESDNMFMNRATLFVTLLITVLLLIGVFRSKKKQIINNKNVELVKPAPRFFIL
jgi:hypothetical protein